MDFDKVVKIVSKIKQLDEEKEKLVHQLEGRVSGTRVRSSWRHPVPPDQRILKIFQERPTRTLTVEFIRKKFKGSPTPTLSGMVKDNTLTRISRGRYRLIKPTIS